MGLNQRVAVRWEEPRTRTEPGGGGGVKGIEYICSTAGCLRCYSQIEDNLQIYAVAEAVCLGAPYIVCRAGLTTIL